MKTCYLLNFWLRRKCCKTSFSTNKLLGFLIFRSIDLTSQTCCQPGARVKYVCLAANTIYSISNIIKYHRVRKRATRSLPPKIEFLLTLSTARADARTPFKTTKTADSIHLLALLVVIKIILKCRNF